MCRSPGIALWAAYANRLAPFERKRIVPRRSVGLLSGIALDPLKGIVLHKVQLSRQNVCIAPLTATGCPKVSGLEDTSESHATNNFLETTKEWISERRACLRAPSVPPNGEPRSPRPTSPLPPLRLESSSELVHKGPAVLDAVPPSIL